MIGDRGKVIDLVFSTMTLLTDDIHIKDTLGIGSSDKGRYWNSNE